MKKITIILIFLTSLAQGQDSWISNDKITHFNTSMTLTFASGQVIEGVTGWKYSYEVAAATVFTAGIAKEMLMDQSTSGKDIAFNAAGVIIGYYVNRVINRKIKRFNLG